MNKPGALGRRIKRTRESKQLTLKAVEEAAGISATHVSEIERGKTSPTIGVLLRIAAALGVAPAYFLEEEELGDVSVVAAEDRVHVSLGEGRGAVEHLTTAIAGGRLQAARIELAVGRGRHAGPHAHRGEEAALVLEGEVRFTVGDRTFDLENGDAIHFDASLPHATENVSSSRPAVLIWISSERGVE